MKLGHVLFCGMAGALFAGNGFRAEGDSLTNPVAASAPVYVPDLSHVNDPLPNGVLAWNGAMLSTNVPANAEQAHFLLSFTNVSAGSVSISDVHPTCGCTTAELPPRPWTIPSGGSGQIPITVNLSLNITGGEEGTLLKAVDIHTDKGYKQILLRIDILPPVIPHLTDAERANGVAIATADRQAVFKNDCATCHAKPGAGRYGKALYTPSAPSATRRTARRDGAGFARPENADQRSNSGAPGSPHGKPGSLMPAFATAEGGPLNDMQIASLAAYLNNCDSARAFRRPMMPGAPAPASDVRLRNNSRALCCQP